MDRTQDSSDARAGRVLATTTRCPYCHEDVAREAADVCRDCLARHHGGCWTEGARCGACGSTHVLRPVRPPLTDDLARDLLRPLGYDDDDVTRWLRGPHGLDRCASPGCLARGVARSGPGPALRCVPHARAAREGTGAAGAVLLLAGLASGGLGAAVGLARHDPAPVVALGLLGACLVALGALVARAPGGLPPLPAPLAPKGTQVAADARPA